MEMKIRLSDDEINRIARGVAEILQASAHEQPAPQLEQRRTATETTCDPAQGELETEPEDEPEVVPYRADRSEIREFIPAVLPPCRNQWRHMKVAKFLLGRTRPVTAAIIAAKIDATVSEVSNSLQYLATNVAPALAEHPMGRSTRWWQATAALRGRGVVAA